MNIKKWIPDIVAVLLFAIISFAYFFPSDIEGRVLAGHDNIASVGAGQEAKEFHEETGKTTRWTNALFGGMPTYQIAPSYNSTTALGFAGQIYKLFLPNYVGLVFIMLLGFYILLRAFGIPVWLSTLGSIAWAFSSYFFILIYAGHIWKFLVLAYAPPTIAGIVLAYRKHYMAGGIIAAFFFALQLLSNHVQMTYYFMFVILAIMIGFFIEAKRNNELKHFAKATCVLVVAALIGITINISNLYHTYKYSKETMRGKSELVKENSENQTNSGLERDYITQWSYGKGETFTLLVPNLKGGSSEHLMADSKVAMEKADPQFRPLYQQIGQYWGEQPGTSGPVYVGAFILMLAVLAMFILKGPMKWALFAVTLLSIFLSWGKNMMWFTDLFIDYMPMYSKFRAVSSILVIAEFTIPLLAILGLKELFDKPELIKERMKYVYISFGLTGGIAFLFWIMPGVFFSSFVSTAETQALSNLPQQYIAPIIANLTEMREAMLASDSSRSFFVILAGTVVLMLVMHKKLKPVYATVIIAAICLVDMWTVNKRYLNDNHFVAKSQTAQTYSKTPADDYILQDESLDYRVLNLTVSTFNDNTTSYYHKSIGGYHAAKLRRYQEMIEHHIMPEIMTLSNIIRQNNGDLTNVDGREFQVLNMLNTKYIIIDKNVALPNPCVAQYGNAWFVDNVEYAENANQEIDRINDIDVRNTAVVDSKFKEALRNATSLEKDSTASVSLISYEPNKLAYKTSSAKDGVIVFSEIYYPEWTATIDGEPVDIARANYILRTMFVPKGDHTIVFSFEPKSIRRTEAAAYTAFFVLIAGALFLIFTSLRKKKGIDKQ